MLERHENASTGFLSVLLPFYEQTLLTFLDPNEFLHNMNINVAWRNYLKTHIEKYFHAALGLYRLPRLIVGHLPADALIKIDNVIFFERIDYHTIRCKTKISGQIKAFSISSRLVPLFKDYLFEFTKKMLIDYTKTPLNIILPNDPSERLILYNFLSLLFKHHNKKRPRVNTYQQPADSPRNYLWYLSLLAGHGMEDFVKLLQKNPALASLAMKIPPLKARIEAFEKEDDLFNFILFTVSALFFLAAVAGLIVGIVFSAMIPVLGVSAMLIYLSSSGIVLTGAGAVISLLELANCIFKPQGVAATAERYEQSLKPERVEPSCGSRLLLRFFPPVEVELKSDLLDYDPLEQISIIEIPQLTL